ncbi:MAG: transporter substrate-binding domain-containing protein [Patescibacteria group bacterium]|jgi:polar amino acid transport system substrate-binding protein
MPKQKTESSKVLLTLLILLLIIGFGSFIYLWQQVSSVKNTKLTLLTEEYPPITYEKDGKITGIATEVVEEIMKKLDVNYDIKLLKWSDAYAKALDNPNTVLFSTERTKEREHLFNWVGPLGKNTTYFYAPADSTLQINNLADAKKAGNIATCSSWFTEQYLKDQGFNNLQSSIDPKKNITQLINKDADLSIFTDMTVGNLAQSAGYSLTDIKPIYKVMETQFYIAMSKGTSTAIVRDWQKAFDKIKNDGTLAKIYQQYVPYINNPY